MRILYSHSLSDPGHPAAVMVETIARELRLLGHKVRVHASSTLTTNSSPGAIANVPGWSKRVGWFARQLGRNLPAYRRDQAALAEFEPDVVLARQDAYRMSMPVAAWRAGLPLVTYADAPVAYESRTYHASQRWHPAGVVEAVERWGLKRSQAVVTVSRPAAELLSRYRHRIPIRVAHNGVDVERFRPATPHESLEIRQQLGISTHHVAGFIGSFRNFHGLPLLREIVERTASRRDLTWLMIGEGPGRPALQQELARFPHVRFLGQQRPERVAQLMASLDVMVSPHQRTAQAFYFCPLKILEGMASGIACLASHQGDIPELLGHGVAGRLVATDAPRAWAEALNQLLDDPVERQRLGTTARNRVLERYTWSATARTVEQTLHQARETFHTRSTNTRHLSRRRGALV